MTTTVAIIIRNKPIPTNKVSIYYYIPSFYLNMVKSIIVIPFNQIATENAIIHFS